MTLPTLILAAGRRVALCPLRVLFPDKNFKKVFYCGASRRRACVAQEKYGLSSQAAVPPGRLCGTNKTRKLFH
ncbi:hypothetical protein [uncultured Dysosmobacter sp.]|uniref:hypothetical protein n=1 Tax=uncultured Dysosmobacter sp. TaxID=2591384 RepID=UPI00260939F1|nr:hypothetical protein [uncultured Dysosmobacter sp.]